ncbi:hypothetical protein [Arthrobacter cupressi]|uniref:Spondin_N n=1 Tax=Arthrobacter cupressi TaxID=1045773 RepID=A0A1G8ICE5_9MICC|nr:hypothetical protein [Arthrobacter cupressi]NYD78973.1 hypothetical protein [Arthrobacter cupressi]SDI16649.1 hypothetical protein SAMN05216555_101201 [Arthrobacter cupressi]
MRHTTRSVVALSLVLFLGACVQPSPGPSPSGADGATPGGSASETPTTAPSSGTPGNSAETWAAYKTKDDTLTFEHPARWTITDPAGQAAAGGIFLSVANEAGKQLATLRTNMVAGAECTTRSPYSLLDSQPLPALAQKGTTPRFVFEGRQGTDPATPGPFAYGITSSPAPSGPDACPIFHFFTWPPSGAAFGGAYNPMEAVEGATPGPDTPEAYMETQEYKDIKRMITSLRPVS